MRRAISPSCTPACSKETPSFNRPTTPHPVHASLSLDGVDIQGEPYVFHKGKAETLGHDTDDGGGLTVGLDPPPDDVGVTSVPVLPDSVCQDDDLLSRTRVFGRVEHPAQNRDPIDLSKKIGGNEGPLKPLRRGGFVGQIHGSLSVASQPTKRGLLLPEIDQVQNRDGAVPRSLIWNVLRERDEYGAAIEVETPDGRAVHDAERVGGEADAKRDGQDGHR